MPKKKRPAADDFDGIPLEGYMPPTGPIDPGPQYICWSCQNSHPGNRLVVLGDECVLPCCLGCWDQLTVAERLRTARELMTYTEQNAANRALADAMSAIARKMKEIDAIGENNDDDPGDFSWLTGRRN